MKQYLWQIAVLVACLASACGSDDETPSMANAASGGSGEGPGEFVGDYRMSPDFVTLMSGMVMGSSPHGWQQTWYSDNLMPLLDRDSLTAPVGSVAIKEFADSGDGPVMGLAVMVKRQPGYDPDNGDWHYEMRTADGELLDMPPPGPIPDCIACHASAAAKDYLAGTDIR